MLLKSQISSDLSYASKAPSKIDEKKKQIKDLEHSEVRDSLRTLQSGLQVPSKKKLVDDISYGASLSQTDEHSSVEIEFESKSTNSEHHKSHTSRD